MTLFKQSFASVFLATLFAAAALAQPGIFSKQDLIDYTSDWTGERFSDGRPKVSDDIIGRMKEVTLEEAWATLRTEG